MADALLEARVSAPDVTRSKEAAGRDRMALPTLRRLLDRIGE